MTEVSTREALRILIVDDSAVYRRILSEVLNAMPNVTLVGTAANGRLALARLKQEIVEFMILDVEMPEMDGLATLKEVKNLYPEIGIVMLSGWTRMAADMTVRALELGALDFLAKGTRGTEAENRQELTKQLSMVMRNFATQRSLRLVRNRLNAVQQAVRTMATDPPPAAATAEVTNVGTSERSPKGEKAQLVLERLSRVALPRPNRIEIVVIGTSTGGPQALVEVIPALPRDLGVPVLVVQHMPPVFTASLAQSLMQKSQLEVVEGQPDDTIRAGRVVIAPGGYHMVVHRSTLPNGQFAHTLAMNSSPPENSCRPSVDVLFRSVSLAYPNNVLAVIMTGMGEDGMRGVRALKQRGCYCITQEAQSCIIYGMPRAVDQAGLSDESVPLNQIAGRISSIVRASRASSLRPNT